jgi:hypothetical protein
MSIELTDETHLTPIQYEIIQQIEAFHAKATALGYIQNPLAWALYQVWQEVDKAEKEEGKE